MYRYRTVTQIVTTLFPKHKAPSWSTPPVLIVNNTPYRNLKLSGPRTLLQVLFRAGLGLSVGEYRLRHIALLTVRPRCTLSVGGKAWVPRMFPGCRNMCGLKLMTSLML